MTVKRQFIAGAACPECGAVDRVQRCTEDDDVWMECVACGMKRRPDEAPEQADPQEQAVKLRGFGRTSDV